MSVERDVPAKWVNEHGQVWLNVGSGGEVEPGHVNLDNHVFMPLRRLYPLLAHVLPRKRAESIERLHLADKRALLVRRDCRKPLEFRSNSIDHILCSHFIEHVYPDQAERILRGFYRVLKPGATLHVIVPDLRILIEAYQAAADGGAAARFLTDTILTQPKAPSIRYRVLQMIGFDGLQHRWMYDKPALLQLLHDIGFVELDSNETPSAHVRMSDGESLHAVVMKPLSAS